MSKNYVMVGRSEVIAFSPSHSSLPRNTRGNGRVNYVCVEDLFIVWLTVYHFVFFFFKCLLTFYSVCMCVRVCVVSTAFIKLSFN